MIFTIVNKGVTDVMVLMKEHEFRKYRVPYLLDEYSKYGITVHHHPMEVQHTLLGYLNKSYRVPQKKWDLFYDQYLHQTEHKSVGYIFNLKGGIHNSIFGKIIFLHHNGV